MPDDIPNNVPQTAGDAVAANTVELGAEPPIEQRLIYNGSLHNEILSRLNARQNLSERGIQDQLTDWQRTDDQCRLYVDLSQKAIKGDGSVNPNKKEIPWERSIVVPLSLAVLYVYLSQLWAIFSRRDPMMEIDGTGPEDMRPAQAMNAVLAYDQRESAFPLQFYQLAQDALKYNRGILHDCWEEQYGWKYTQTKIPRQAWGAIQMFRPGWTPTTRNWDVLKQFNLVEAIDPYCVMADPRVSLTNLQKGEFFGHRTWKAYLEIVEKSKDNGGPYFNVDDIARVGASGATRQQATPMRTRFNMQHMALVGSSDEKDKGFHAVDHLQVNLIPSEWKLGTSTRPEKWWFSWVDNRVIIRAHPSQYRHGQFNYSAAESNIDTHVSGGPGTIMNLDGISRFMTWHFNSHMENVRRFLNNSMVFAPSLIEQVDILNPNAAGHIRLTALGEQMLISGKMTVEQMFHQVQLTDVTGSMLRDNSVMLDMALRMAGVSDAGQAQMTQQKRTLGEVDRAVTGQNARTALHAALLDVQCMKPTALRMIANRQQFTEAAQYYRITGDLLRTMGTERALIAPDDIQGNFDYFAKTGPLPPDPATTTDAWDRLQQTLTANPMLLQPRRDGRALDPHELLDEYAKTVLGIRNFDSFYTEPVQVQVRPDEQIAAQRAAGNVVPLDQVRGAA